MLRLPPYDKIGANPTPDHVNADPTNSVAGSILNALIFNQLQHEGENLQMLAGLTPDGTNLLQWTQAVSRGGIWAGALTGTGDLAVATLALPNTGDVLPALLQGMRISAVASAPNTVTNPKLRVRNVGAAGLYRDFPIIKEDGSALAAGEIVAGRRYRYEADGAGNVQITGGGIGFSGSSIITTLANATARARLKQQNSIPDVTTDTNAINNYQFYQSAYTDLGTFTLQPGFVFIDLDAACFAAAANTSQVGLFVGIFGNANDGSGWFLIESNRIDKLVGATVTLSRPGGWVLDPTKSYTFSARIAKDGNGGASIVISGNLLGNAFKF